MGKTKDTIFEAALSIFSKNGYDKATMDDIALNAGVAKGTLYYYFKSKGEIFNSIINEKMQNIRDQLEAAAARETNPLLKLNTLIKGQLNIVSENREFFKVVISQIWGREDRQNDLKVRMNEYILFIEKFLKESMENGIIKEGNTELIAYNIIGGICSTAMYELLNGESDSKNYINSAVYCILKAITQVPVTTLESLNEMNA